MLRSRSHGARQALVTWRRQAGALVREAARLRFAPRPVAVFYLRAWWTAVRTRDRFTLDSASRPSDVLNLLALAHGHAATVELGTGTAWTAIALALEDHRRRVVSYDPVIREERERYLALVPPAVRARIELHALAAEDAEPQAHSVGFLFIDCAHHRAETAAAFRAWRAAVVGAGVVAFHDYDHPLYPGVREAVEELGLKGERAGGVFVWRKPAD